MTVDLNGEAVAYPYDVLSELNVINDTVGGEDVVILWTEGTASALDASNIPERGAKSVQRLHIRVHSTIRIWNLNSRMEKFSTHRQAVNGIFSVSRLWEK